MVFGLFFCFCFFFFGSKTIINRFCIVFPLFFHCFPIVFPLSFHCFSIVFPFRKFVFEEQSTTAAATTASIVATFGTDKNQMILFHCDDGWLARLSCDHLRDAYGYQNVKAASLKQLISMKFWNKKWLPVSLLEQQVKDQIAGQKEII